MIKMIKIPKSNQFKNDIKMLQFNIADNLLKVYKRPNINFKMSICDQTAEYFKKKGLNCSRFKPCFTMLGELNIKTVNKYSIDGVNLIQEDSFHLKLIKPKQKNLISKENNVSTFSSNYQLSSKFIRKNEIELSEADRQALRNFAQLDL